MCFIKVLSKFSILKKEDKITKCLSFRKWITLSQIHQPYVFGEDEDYNKPLRHAAYREFTLWKYQYLGTKNRRVIPSCCVWKIRDKFASLDGNYTGLRANRLA